MWLPEVLGIARNTSLHQVHHVAQYGELCRAVFIVLPSFNHANVCTSKIAARRSSKRRTAVVEFVIRTARLRCQIRFALQWGYQCTRKL